jgi:hypothetical protein
VIFVTNYVVFEVLKCIFLCRERILEYRDESKRLDQCSRLYDSSVSNEGFELDASQIIQVVYFCFCVANYCCLVHQNK